MNFDLLRTLAKRSGLKNWQLGQLCGGNRVTVYKKMHGKVNWKMSDFLRFCKACGATKEEVWELLDYENVEVPEWADMK